VIRGLDPANPGHAAFAVRASRLFRGAGYRAWTRAAGEPPPPHAAIAAPYAHVTAPLRRMALDNLESVLLAGRIGEVFDATVVDVRDDRPVVQIADPAVVAQLDTRGPRPGERLRVRLAEADPAARRVVFAPA
jgi:exoribonuclease R